MIIATLVGVLVVYALVAYIRRKIAKPDYKGKTVWITGASSGIGEYLAYEFNKHGAKVILTARNQNELQRVKQACLHPDNVQIIPLDMTKYDLVRKTTQQFLKELENQGKHLDIVVENAGVSMRCEFENYCFENHTGMFDINVHAPFNHLQAVLPHFIKQGGGQIVGITSLAAKLAKAYRSSYAGSKHAFLGILDSLRSEVAPYGIKVCSILPGYIKTNLSKNALGAGKGERFGKNDENNQKGMEPQDFAKQAVGAIFNNQNEVSIGKEWLPVFGLILRDLCPDLTFQVLRSSAKDKPSASPKQE